MVKKVAMNSPPAGTQIRTGVGLQLSASGLAAAQQLAVTDAHQGDAASDQANGLVTQRTGFPGVALDPASAEQGFGDGAIRGFGKMAIEGAHHQNQAITALSGQCRRLFSLVRLHGHQRP